MEYPATPNLVPGVLAAIDRARPAEFPGALRAVAVAAAVALIVAAALLAALDQSRDAIARFLGLAVEGEVIEILPTPAGQATVALPTPAAIEDIAEPIDLAGAGERLGFEPALPEDRTPMAAYYLEYRLDERPNSFVKPFLVVRFDGFDLWEATSEGLVGKGIYLGSDTVVEQTHVGKADAYWLEGGPRIVTIHAPGGEEIVGSGRTVTANALVWSIGNRYFRIEGDLELAEAVAIAESIAVRGQRPP